MLLCSLFLSCVLGADPTDQMLVENDRVSIDLSSRGSVIKAVDKKSGRVLFFTSAQRPLFQSNRSQTGHDPWTLAWCLVHGQIPHLAPRLGLGSGPMIVDGGFERSYDEGSVEFPRTMMFPGEGWFVGETEIDRVERHSGQASLKLYNHASGDRALAAQNYEITPDFCPGRTYRLSVWIRSRQIAKPNGLLLKAFAPGMSALQTWQLPYPADQAEWTRGQLDFTLSEGTTVLRVMLFLDGAGTVWLDDLQMEEVLADGRSVEVRRPARPVDHEFMRQWIALYQGERRTPGGRRAGGLARWHPDRNLRA